MRIKLLDNLPPNVIVTLVPSTARELDNAIPKVTKGLLRRVHPGEPNL
jgi:hypothetical protein